jgi:hypothetical protein
MGAETCRWDNGGVSRAAPIDRPKRADVVPARPDQQAVDWYGQKLSSEDWKDVLTASLRRTRVVPGIDAGTFVPLGMRTSQMTKEEISDLLELIYAFGAERGVKFRELELVS